MIPRSLFSVTLAVALLVGCRPAGKEKNAVRIITPFNNSWRFTLADSVTGPGAEASEPSFDDSRWRELDLPHDWSIEGTFSPEHPATPGGGALPGGTGWYRKSFVPPPGWEERRVFVEFDGIYQESEVWINGNLLGRRPNGYISFRYELTPYLNRDGSGNLIAVRVDNSKQPNSRWYSGSGIYREVRLVMTSPVHVDHWGTYVTTSEISSQKAAVVVETTVRNSLEDRFEGTLISRILSPEGRVVAESSSGIAVPAGEAVTFRQRMEVTEPMLWSVDQPALYNLVSEIRESAILEDHYETAFGIRFFEFDPETGFSLNGEPMKLKGVCNHHDLGALGAAVYPRALERQLEILKQMGCNAIRTSHNPPAPVLLELCDRMGFLVMDETFDMWKMQKTQYDYHLHWDAWHERDLTDHILRDRNHPSVILWSIGNEIVEQRFDSGEQMAISLAGRVRELDPTRPVTSGCDMTSTTNSIMRSGALDVIGFNYHLADYRNVPANFPGKPFIATETTSALANRGVYDMPSDGVRIWPVREDTTYPVMNADHTCSAYDNCHVPWGSTHEDALLEMKNHAYVSGMFVWTGFDYLGEPTPYGWPSRSSYFGIIDLAGFPKDAFYLYQSEWTGKPVLHLFPHWNWKEGDSVDVWIYTSCPEVELFLNGNSLGRKEKAEGSLHMQWRVAFAPGRVEARGEFMGEQLATAVETAGEPAAIRLTADRKKISADPLDLCFVTAEIVDSQGRVVPMAGNRVRFRAEGEGEVLAVDNGLQTSMEPFRASERSTYNGLCLAIVKSNGNPGTIRIEADSEGLRTAELEIAAR